MHSKQLADMISSRICHDLISPIGAISNGVELMAEMNKSSPELALINQSANNAKAKLMFFRVAFGGGNNEAMVGYASASSVALEMFAAGRVSVAFPEPWGDRSRSLVKLLYLLLLCVESSMPRGGTINCSPTNSGWCVRVTDTPTKADPNLWNAMLKGDPFGDLNANQIQFQLARDAAENIDIKIEGKFSDDGLCLTF